MPEAALPGGVFSNDLANWLREALLGEGQILETALMQAVTEGVRAMDAYLAERIDGEHSGATGIARSCGPCPARPVEARPVTGAGPVARARRPQSLDGVLRRPWTRKRTTVCSVVPQGGVTWWTEIRSATSG
jgi:hypothetical protein